MKKCCVLIPYYNDATSLIESICSIDYEYCRPDIIVIDDGSDKIKAIDIIQNYQGPLRIELVSLDENKGIEYALNYGLELYSSKYEYIARLDCGDLCKNNRIAKQILFLDKNKEYQVVGSWADFIDMQGRHLITIMHPTEHDDIKRGFLFNSMIVHVSAMFRASVFQSVGFYPTNSPAAEDYALFTKIVKNYKVANLSEALVTCTVDPNGISTVRRRRQIKSRIKVMIDNFTLTPNAIFGIVRSAVLLLVPRSLSLKLKGLFS